MTAPGPSPPRPIRRLPPSTVEKIAAGEVVERPASVVKELVENAVDAGATEVRVQLREGGLALLRVDDDGGGIPAEELPLAVERHATSKLAHDEDLETVATLGFRGEALAAIGSVGRMTLISRTAGDEAAHILRVEGGEARDGGVAGRPPGTTVEVRDLFFNTPARRKFLRSAAAEQVEVASVLERLYLARPDVGVTVSGESGELGHYPASSSLKDACARVFGPEFLTQSFEVSADLPDGGRLHAVLGRPEVSRGTSQALHLSVNGRAVVARPLAQAVRAAFIDHLPRTRFPVGALALTLPPRRVDVNVHPTKREVRFQEERPLAEAIRQAVRRTLQGRVAAAEAPHEGGARPHLGPSVGSRWGSSVPAAMSVPGALRARQRSLVDASPAPVVSGDARHPDLRLLGCVGRLYWVGESEDGLVLIDQHAASERVAFEALRRDGRLGRQELLHPVLVELPAKARAALAANESDVRRAGFEVEPFGGERYRIAAVPSFLGRRMAPEALRPLLDELAEGGRPTLPDGLVDRVAASIACHAAVRAGDTIEAAEMERILGRLYSLADGNYACPHGRPIFVRVPRARLDRWFLRAGG